MKINKILLGYLFVLVLLMVVFSEYKIPIGVLGAMSLMGYYRTVKMRENAEQLVKKGKQDDTTSNK